jgi:hypothetical protein
MQAFPLESFVRGVCNYMYGKTRRVSTARGTDPRAHFSAPYTDLLERIAVAYT